MHVPLFMHLFYSQ